jgi:hypothetical protein
MREKGRTKYIYNIFPAFSIRLSGDSWYWRGVGGRIEPFSIKYVNLLRLLSHSEYLCILSLVHDILKLRENLGLYSEILKIGRWTLQSLITTVFHEKIFFLLHFFLSSIAEKRQHHFVSLPGLLIILRQVIRQALVITCKGWKRKTKALLN